jgi:hypothetical protein
LRALLNTRPLSEKFSAWRRWNSRFAMRIAIEKNRGDQIADFFSVMRDMKIFFFGVRGAANRQAIVHRGPRLKTI